MRKPRKTRQTRVSGSSRRPPARREGRRKSTPQPKTRILRQSTRRLTPTREAPTAELAAETLQVTFRLLDVANRPIADPETFFTFRRLTDNRQIGDQLAVAVGARAPRFALPVATGEVLFCEIDPRRFRFVQSPVFFGSPGPPLEREVRLLREPSQWRPRFASWSALPPSFGALKDVLRVSPGITLFREVVPLAELLIEDAYEGLSGSREALAKTALLNGYFRLSRTADPVTGTRSWFSYVRRITAIGRERFLAFVDPEMEAQVRQIHTHIDRFRGEYERTPAENHRGNVPATLQPRIGGMISIKSAHRKGNFQLTLTRLVNPDEVLLDADVDESGDLLGHILDLFKHKISGGTHPHDIHELLVLQEGSTPGFDLGYELQ